jgi:excisionase family DNA binding protein
MSRKISLADVRLLTTREAAAELGIHERTVRRYISSGLLAYRRLPGGHYRIPEQAILDFWDQGGGIDTTDRQRDPLAEPRSASPDPDAVRATAQRSRPPHHCGDSSYDLSPEALAALRARMVSSNG